MIPLLRRRIIGGIVLGGACLLGGGWLGHLDFRQKISTDVLDLLPPGERSPELAMVRSLASDAAARTVFIVLTVPGGNPAPEAAARLFATELARSPAFDQAVSLGDPAPREALAAEVFRRRLSLMFPQWLSGREAKFAADGGDPGRFSEWLATDAASSLGGFLEAPEALAFQDILPSDPLLLMPGAAGRFEGGLSLEAAGASEAGDTRPSAGTPARVWARTAASPLSEEGQVPVFAAIARATAATAARFPGLESAYTGVCRIAAASKDRIRRELSWLNALSFAAVLAIVFGFVRGAHRALHLAPPVLIATLGAWVCVTAAFSRVHILVFVVGAMLTGVAVDYGFYLYMQPQAEGEDYWAKVRRLAKPLLSSCFTTVAGFALLLLSPLPLIRQLGAFVGAGLLCALGASVVYFSMLRKAFLEPRRIPGLARPPPGARRVVRRLIIAVWLVALPGLFRLKWRDDIREMEIPSPALQREDERIRGIFGGSGTAYLTRGSTLDEARTSLGRFDAWLLKEEGPKAAFINLADVLPTEAEYAAAVRFLHEHPDFPERLRAALAAGGFKPAGFEPFFTAYSNWADHVGDAQLDESIKAVQARLAGPLSLLMHSGPPPDWLVTLANDAPTVAPPPETATLAAGELQSLNRIFARYRQSALQLSLVGLAIVGTGVVLTYGARDGARIFAIPCGTCLGLFGCFGWMGQPLNLFHLLGAFLGVCLTHNYSIFSATSAYRREAPPVSVRLSALTASASFGVLALSAIPVVRALGETVAPMTLAALAAIEFEHFKPLEAAS